MAFEEKEAMDLEKRDGCWAPHMCLGTWIMLVEMDRAGYVKEKKGLIIWGKG